MDVDLWLAFAAASLLMAIIPGPGVASIVGFAFSAGRRTALAAVAGMAVGNATAISVSLAGAGAILASSALAFILLKWIGAAYLITVGLLAVFRSRTAAAATPSRPISPRAAFATTVMVGTFHPKTILFFVAFAAQFIGPDRPFMLQAAVLVATFTLIAAGTDMLYALAASRASGLIHRPGVRLWSQRIGGGVIATAGVTLAAARR